MQTRQEHQPDHNRRVRTLEGIFAFCLFILATRFYLVQIRYHKELQAQAERQYGKRTAQVSPQIRAESLPVESGRQVRSTGLEAKALVFPRINIHTESKKLEAERINPPGKQDLPSQVAMPSVQGLSMRRVLRVMARQGLQVEFEGSGLAVEQAPLAGKNVPGGTLCRVRFAGLSQPKIKDL